MEAAELAVEIRKKVGKSVSSRERRDGFIPAVLYGPGAEPQAISVNESQWQKLLRDSGNRLSFLNLKIKQAAGDSLSPAIVKSVQRHPVNERIIHIDFQRVSLTQKMVVEVPVQVEGVAPGTKVGAILQQPVRAVEVRCLPTEIPKAAIADVSAMEVGSALTARELKLPPEAELQTDPDVVVVTVTMVYMQQEEETAAPEAAVAAAEVPAQPEVIGEKERDERRLKKGEEKEKREAEKTELKETQKKEQRK